MKLGGAAQNQIKIGTRASPLALAQAKEVAGRLAAYHGLPDDCFEIVPLTTRGDRLDERPLPEVGVKGLFTIELEERLLSRGLDLAVHSAKDVATTLPDGLHLSAFLPREDVREVLISRPTTAPGGSSHDRYPLRSRRRTCPAGSVPPWPIVNAWRRLNAPVSSSVTARRCSLSWMA
ncbi:hypothetical protein HFN84_36695 [Rhizobium laguerreae]|nr:hypothetical protein [Rhizobium laguerreae]MBY3356146.1 hypothetical protein [Rhizobium laguerreae]MBY3370193.1 hypothetical protein [Rhizobium laguerreae]MBY3377211.1 hypothetical protein [Rhizobium laguerreae]MBY3432452.1 hypothetical protein [Rhizobium laguerreae]